MTVASMVGSEELKAVDVSVAASLLLAIGNLLYQVECRHQPQWNMGEITKYTIHSSSDLDEDHVGQNFIDQRVVMETLKIFSWNARGVGCRDFKRIFAKFMATHNPSLVLLTETHVGGDRHHEIISSLGFSSWYAVEPMGYVRGIWLLWNRRLVKVTIHGHTFQQKHATVEVSNLPLLFISFIYASPDRDKRKVLWKNNSDIAPLISGPWVAISDFNDLVDEKWGGNAANISRISDFQNCLNSCNLVDLGFRRQKFTWCNKRFDGQLVFQRLDIFVGNSKWIQTFPESIVLHLPRIKSNHNPILFISKLSTQSFAPKPFCCERIWLNQPEFHSITKEVWRTNQSDPIFHTLSILKEHLIA